MRVLLPLGMGVLALLVLLVAGGFALAMCRRRWLIADLPTSDAAHVFVGMNEVEGTVVPLEEAIVAPYSATECVWYRAILEKEVQSGDSKRWKQVSDESSEAPFWLEDATGRVLVRPKGASVHAPRRHRATHGGRPERYGRLSLLRSLAGGAPLPPLASDLARHRTTEWYLQPGDRVYALGEATLRTDAVALELAPADATTGVTTRPLLLSYGDERRTATRTNLTALLLLLVTMAAAAGIPPALHAFVTAREEGPQPGDPSTLEATGRSMVLAAGLVLAVLAVLYVGRLHNRLVSVRNRAQAAWSLIDVHLRRRHDLLPELAAVVGAAAAHERSVQEAVARRRTQAHLGDLPALPDGEAIDRTEHLDRTDRADGALLLAVAEAYPELRAGEAFQRLQSELVRAEDGIAFARRFYNDAINVLRDRRRQFPGLLLAPLVPVPSLELWQEGTSNEVGRTG